MADAATMADERTPLIAVVHVAPPPRPRYPHRRLRNCCTGCLATLLVLCISASLLTLIFVPDCDRIHRRHHVGVCIPKHPFYRPRERDDHRFSILTDEGGVDLIEILASTPNETKAREWSQYYTAGPHLAGKNLSQAEWTKDRWDEFGIPHTQIATYQVYLNYPVDHRLTLLERETKGFLGPSTTWNVKFEASLKEDVLEQDGTSGLEDQVPTFHGYSASGNVTAPFMYVNYGTYQDFEDLLAANVSLKGNIAIAKYGKIFRGLKVKRAQELGMAGMVMYSDPGDDGDFTEENGSKLYPSGPGRNPTSVQRGSVQFLSIAPGDPTTPGYPSLPGCPRGNASDSTPLIPSLPISYADAVPILKALNGHGPVAKSLGDSWATGGLAYKGVEYSVGPTPDSLALNLYNEQEYVITPLWNVIGIINGTFLDEVVVVGNHRDAWIAGGAGDPNSGSAALNEVVRGFGLALTQGWKPMRTIVFASWDGEEYGLVGSTEWVEEYLPWLNATVIAYINIDTAVSGPHFSAASSPILNGALIETAKLVLSPNQTEAGQTVYDVWDKHIATMGSGSDFTAFQDFAGIPSISLGFGPARDAPVYHYHSSYDSFYWMDNFGDPGWHYHATAARVLGLLTARIAETAIVPLNVTDYADALHKYLDAVKGRLLNSTAVEFGDGPSKLTPLDGLQLAVQRLRNATVAFDEEASAFMKDMIENPIPWWKWWQRIAQGQKLRLINTRYKLFERQFLYAAGLDGRSWFKHVVFAPGLWTGYSGATFPGLVEAIDQGDIGGLYRWTNIVLALIEKARGSLTV